MLFVYIAAGGAVGALARYAVGGWVYSWAGTAFPWGTFAVNVSGSFLLGLAMRLLDSAPVGAELRGLLTVGFLGAFTTFSTFTYEAMTLMQQGAWGRAAAYLLGSVLLGLLGLWAGVTLATLSLRGAG